MRTPTDVGLTRTFARLWKKEVLSELEHDPDLKSEVERALSRAIRELDAGWPVEIPVQLESAARRTYIYDFHSLYRLQFKWSRRHVALVRIDLMTITRIPG